MNAPLRVLLADDVSEIRAIVGRRLARDGRFQVVGEASDGAQAVSLAVVHDPDVVLLDLAMPVMDGFEALREIRARAPRAKVVVLSGFDRGHVESQALRLGASACIEKGTALQSIAETLADLCDAPSRSATAGGDDVPADAASQLVAYVIHELNTPIAVIDGFAQTLEEELDVLDPETVRDAVRAIRRNVNVLGELVRRFNDARAIDRGSLTVEAELTDLASLVRERVGDLTAVLEDRPVRLSLDEPCPVVVDPGRIGQVLRNLVGNAVRYSPAGTPVTIDLRRGDHEVLLGVADQGPGIPPGSEELVFEKFVRLDRSVKGTGIGLSIARGIARAHGGDLVVDRDHHGGARFVLSLPL